MTESNFIGFPNIGLGPWEINKFLISAGDFRVAWYGLIITVGILVAVLVTCRNAKKEHFTVDDVLDYAIWVVLSGVIGARLYYVAMTWDGRYKSFYDVIAVWEGGLAIYGGIIGGALAIAVVSLIKKKNMIKFFDMVAPGVLIAQGIGRWGNFMNGEAYGSITSYEFLGRTFSMTRSQGQAIPWIMTLQETASSSTVYAHPTFLYESLWCVLGFVLIMLAYKKKKFDGQIVFSYIVWYGFGRMFIEGFRTDSLYLGNVRVSQLLALGCVIFGVIFYHMLKKKGKPALILAEEHKEYVKLFSTSTEKAEKETKEQTTENDTKEN